MNLAFQEIFSFFIISVSLVIISVALSLLLFGKVFQYLSSLGNEKLVFFVQSIGLFVINWLLNFDRWP